MEMNFQTWKLEAVFVENTELEEPRLRGFRDVVLFPDGSWIGDKHDMLWVPLADGEQSFEVEDWDAAVELLWKERTP